MFSSLTSLTNPTGRDWGERLLNTIASKTIRYLFTQSESVEVFIHCYPSSKLLQGSIDSFKMSGRGLVIRKDFQAEEMSLITDAVAIDFSSLLRGKLALAQPTQAVDLERFDLDGITMRLNRLETQEKLLIFSGYAQIERIPASS